MRQLPFTVLAAALLASACAAPAQPARSSASAAAPRTILFIGNSFTQGAHSAVRNWRADSVTDLNRAGYGGVPALFKAFARQAGLDYQVSLETQGGKSLGFHYDERRQTFDRAWDVVVLQEYSTLDRDKPGDPTTYGKDVGRLATLLKARNPAVDLRLMATWTRADLVYKGKGRWAGTPVGTMAADLDSAARWVCAANRAVRDTIPVGLAWNRAMAIGVADPNPYDGIAAGTTNLWTYDHYHGGIAGYYLEALVVFGSVTGVDPVTLGDKEQAADELGLGPALTAKLQQVASAELKAHRPCR